MGLVHAMQSNGPLHQVHTLQAMTNDSDLNMGNNIGKRDTQFFGMFWLKTLEN